jgi:hypothetical protein
MDKTLRELRILHLGFLASWVGFLVVTFAMPKQSRTLPGYFPLVLGIVSLSDVFICFYLRKKRLSSAASKLATDPQNHAGIADWRMAYLLSFTFATTVTLFGLVTRLLGWGWSVAAVFYTVGLALLILWAPNRLKLKRWAKLQSNTPSASECRPWCSRLQRSESAPDPPFSAALPQSHRAARGE